MRNDTLDAIAADGATRHSKSVVYAPTAVGFTALLVFLSLGGCARTAVHADAADVLSSQSELLRFDNEERDRADVYLVSETRTWRLGYVEPGQTRWLMVPQNIPVRDLARLQLVVLANAGLSIDPRRDPRAITSLQQPMSALAGQRWAFWRGQLTSQRVDVRRAPPARARAQSRV